MGPVHKGLFTIGKAVEEEFAIVFHDEAGIQADDAAPVRFLPDQPSEPLFKFDNGIGDGIFLEGISPSFDDRFCPCLDNRFAGDFKGEFDDDDTAERISRHIDSFPKGICPKQDGPFGCFKFGEEGLAVVVPLFEEGIAMFSSRFANAS